MKPSARSTDRRRFSTRCSLHLRRRHALFRYGACTATQTASPPNAIPDGALPTLIVPATSTLTGSIRETVPAAVFATHTRPPPTATAVGSAPTGIVLVELVSGSMRVTASAPLSATQTAPSPNAMATGPRPTRIGRPTVSYVFALKRVTVESPELTTQTEPLPTATPAGLGPTKVASTSAGGLGSTQASVESP